MRWLQKKQQGRPLAPSFFASPSLVMTISLTAALTQVSVSSKETRVQRLFWEVQMGVKGRRGETCFHGFKLFLSRCCFPPLQQLISPVLGLRSRPASPRFSAAWQGVSHLGKSFAEGHGREASSLLLLMWQQALPHVAPHLLLSFQVAVSHCGFLPLFKLPLAQMRPSCMSTLAALNHGGCNTSGISHSPHLSSLCLQGRRHFTALLFPSLSSTERMPQHPHLFKDSHPLIQLP